MINAPGRFVLRDNPKWPEMLITHCRRHDVAVPACGPLAGQGSVTKSSACPAPQRSWFVGPEVGPTLMARHLVNEFTTSIAGRRGLPPHRLFCLMTTGAEDR